MKSFISLSESPLKVRMIAVYRLLISFLVPQLLRFKDLKNDRKMVRKMRGTVPVSPEAGFPALAPVVLLITVQIYAVPAPGRWQILPNVTIPF